MNIILADAAPSAASLGNQVMVFAFYASIAGNIALVLTLFIKPKISPQPLEVKAAAEFARENDCLQRHNTMVAQMAEVRQQRITDAKDAGYSRKAIYTEIEGVRKEMGEMERRLNAADEDRTTAVHERLNDILLAVGELRGKAKNQS